MTMKTVDCWLDPISPYAWLAFHQLPRALQGCHYVVQYRPVLLVGLLRHWGQKGPAEIVPKREWTFRQVAWLAQRHDIPYAEPTPHPFNPLALLRLLLAAAEPGSGLPSRHQVELVLRHVWDRPDGAAADPNDADRLQALRSALAPAGDPDSEAVKLRLRAATDDAIARGVFGVPTFGVDGELFWGLDALPMLRERLEGAAAG